MAGSLAKKTRQSLNTNLSLYLGGPRKFLPTEFPTLRDSLRRCLDLQHDQILTHEKDQRNVSMQEIFSEVAIDIAARWSSSNSELNEPVVCSEKAVQLRLSRAWATISEIARGKARKAIKEEWEPRLDKLFDISFCRCPIVLCGEDGAPCKETCDAQAHCLCKCDPKLRLPKKELIWIKAQREKEGSVSSMQEFRLDAEETAKLRKKDLRKSVDQARLERQREEVLKAKQQAATIVDPCTVTFDADDMGDDMDIADSNDEIVSDSEDDSVSEKPESYLKRNHLDISSAAVASVRFGVSSTATAAIINGLLGDLVKAGHLDEDKKYLLCDTKKVFRAKERAMNFSSAEENSTIEKSDITGIFVDSRKDNTLTLMHDETTGTCRKRIIKESHMAVTEEPKGRYLTHYTPEAKTRAAKPAKQCAVGLCDWMKDRGIDLSLELIGSDTTNDMSGWKGGMLHYVEQLLDRRLFRSFCCLHINELPFRHIVAKLDGPTSSDKGWSGTVGKLFSKVETLQRNTEFEPIPLLEPLVDISEDIASKMSTDSVVAWKYLHAVVKGKLDPEVAAVKCGQLSHSRWLTCGMRCLLLYMSKHDLGPEDAEVLKLLATWVTQVYLPMFYEIKVNHEIKCGPWHLIKLFRLWQKQDARVKDASQRYLRSESWWAHPENVLVALLCSDDTGERVFAVDTIMNLRAGNEYGSTAVRPFKVPETVNLDACDLKTLIDWKAETITEPVFTARMSLAELDALKMAPLELPPYSLHTQSCERAVKLVTEAAESVCGWAKRDGFVRTQMRNREMMPSLKTKKDFVKVFQV